MKKTMKIVFSVLATSALLMGCSVKYTETTTTTDENGKTTTVTTTTTDGETETTTSNGLLLFTDKIS